MMSRKVTQVTALVALWVTLSAGQWAFGDVSRGTIEITGRGEVQSNPEFARLEVLTSSICYKTSLEAKNANAELANRVIKVLNRYKRTERDKVLASGGPNSRQTEYIDVGGTTGRKILCERKWRATNTLILETSVLDRTAELQDEILSAMNGLEQPNEARVEQTFGQLGQPSFHLYADTLLRLRSEAQQKAYQDARDQLAVFASGCKLIKPKLTSITPLNVRTYAKYASPAAEAGSHATPVIPDKLTVEAVWKFIWSFDPAENCLL